MGKIITANFFCNRYNPNRHLNWHRRWRRRSRDGCQGWRARLLNCGCICTRESDAVSIIPTTNSHQQTTSTSPFIVSCFYSILFYSYGLFWLLNIYYSDRIMVRLDKEYPQYGLAGHKGYPTKAHIAACYKHGASPVHRITFAPLKTMTETQLKFRPWREWWHVGKRWELGARAMEKWGKALGREGKWEEQEIREGGWMDAWIHGWMNGWTDRWMDRRMIDLEKRLQT